MKEDGVWRTIRGRRIYIGKGESLGSAMSKSGKFNNQMSRVKKNKDKYDIIDKAKKFDKDLKKTNRERYDIDKSHEKDKWEEQEKYKARHNTKEAQRYEKNEYKQNDNKTIEDFKAKKQSNNKVETWEEKVKRLEKENAKNKNYEIPEQSNNKVDDNYYKGTKRWGFGYANDDNIPVYNNKIDYTGDFTHANLSKVSDDDLIKALNKQSELYHEASNRQVGDRRTRNGKNDEIFKKTDLLRYENGMNKLNEEMKKRNMPRYNIYNNKTNTIMASSPTQEMANRQLKEMYDTDKKLGEYYGWKEYPEYKIKTGYVDDYLKETKDSKAKVEAYKKRKGK